MQGIVQYLPVASSNTHKYHITRLTNSYGHHKIVVGLTCVVGALKTLLGYRPHLTYVMQFHFIIIIPGNWVTIVTRTLRSRTIIMSLTTDKILRYHSVHFWDYVDDQILNFFYTSQACSWATLWCWKISLIIFVSSKKIYYMRLLLRVAYLFRWQFVVLFVANGLGSAPVN